MTRNRQTPAGRRAGGRWLMVWLLPLLWGAISFMSLREPGDEYGLFFVSSIAGIWIFAIIEDSGTPWGLYPWVLATGVVVMAVLGILLDLLRARRWWWLGLWAAVAVALLGTTLADYPSYQRAMSKNGSLGAYIYFSLNAGLTVASLIMLVVAALLPLFRRGSRPGGCLTCGYDLTGNVSGTCPECGCAIENEESPDSRAT